MNRNSKALGDEVKPASETVPSILGWYAEYQVAHVNPTVPVRVLRIKWQKLMIGVIKLNVDAAFDSPTSQVGLGGVFRDANGSFLWGFRHSLSCAASTKHAELLSLIMGMECALSHGLEPVVVEIDYLELVQGVTGQSLEFYELGFLILDLRQLLIQANFAKVVHVQREANMVAHSLAREAKLISYSNDIFDVSHSSMEMLLF
ncbi:hypothetical protein ACLB2K_066843 [Fragaria x ananassa]